MSTRFIFAPVFALFVSSAAYAAERPCEVEIYAPAANAENEEVLLLGNSDIESVRVSPDPRGAYEWALVVAEHAVDDWDASINNVVGSLVSFYCDGDLFAEPRVQMPLGKEFRVVGMSSGGK